MQTSVLLAPRLQSTGSTLVAHGLSCSLARGIFPDQGSNPYLLHWQADSLPLRLPRKLNTSYTRSKSSHFPSLAPPTPLPFLCFFGLLHIDTEHSIGLENGEIVLALVFQERY